MKRRQKSNRPILPLISFVSLIVSVVTFQTGGPPALFWAAAITWIISSGILLSRFVDSCLENMGKGGPDS